MNRILHFLLTILSLMLLSSCSQKSATAHPVENRRGVLINFNNDQLFSEIEQSCVATGGTFRDEMPICLCPRGKFFQVKGFSAGCSPLDSIKVVKGDDLSDRMNIFLKKEQTVYWPDDSESYFTSLAGKTEEGEEAREFSLPIPFLKRPYVLKIDVLKLSEMTFENFIHEKNAFIEERVVDGGAAYLPMTKSLIVKDYDPQSLDQILAPKVNYLTIKVPGGLLSSGGLTRIDLSQMGRPQVNFSSAKKCLEVCHVSRFLDWNDGQLEWKKIIAGGQLLSNYIIHRKSGAEQVDWVLHLSSNNEISFISEYKLGLDSEKDQLMNTITLRDETGKVSHAFQRVIRDKISQEIQIMKLVNLDNLPFQNKALGMMCDQDVSWQKILSEGVLKKTFFTYVPFAHYQRAGIFKGSLGLNEFLMVDGPSNFLFNDKHHVTELLKLVEEDRHQFFPIAFTDCPKIFAAQSKEIVEKNIRVVNISATHVMNQKACEGHEFTRVIKGDEGKSFMWVLSAGNGGLKAPRAGQNSCPQSAVAGAVNALVVASGADNNLGRDYVDLFVEGKGEGPLPATLASSSAAAMVASDFALELINQYKNLSIKEIKLAMILSAIPHPMNSHSFETNSAAGGFLDRSNAHKIAKIMEDNPRITDDEIIEQIFGTPDEQGNFHCSALCRMKKSYQKEYRKRELL